ncbi:WW domain-binding protein 4-like [Plakobranchus ocellatus]|uniref:WW domain-binding protein 4-like n=1 Tax=Plakobranchus ocellatus TaxID=259542 RepID=A0AAV3YH52_9GAST|nr:WW domain-binding protein 4-like [Plakobranchus ocellatus]
MCMCIGNGKGECSRPTFYLEWVSNLALILTVRTRTKHPSTLSYTLTLLVLSYTHVQRIIKTRRSEYWKSVPRKFCDFCKCWITDNKPSVEFHERGKRHKENVELRLKEVRKKSLQQSKDDEQVNAQMEKMEKAALEAFKKDLKDNPALAAQYGISLQPKPDSAKESAASSKADAEPEESGKKKKKKKKKVYTKEWYEAQSPEGYSYYWNTITGESKWEAPEEYMSLEEQRALEAQESSQSADSKKTEKAEITKETSSEKPAQSIEYSNAAQTQSQSTKVDPGHARSAYGAWDVVKEVERPQVYDETSAPPSLDEIPLPVQETDQAEPEPKKPKIKEKVVSLGPSSGGPVAFKKRKIAGARNARQKMDND